MYAMPTARILLVDDHPRFVAQVRRLLETHPDVRVVGSAASGEESLALTQALRPDVVFLDISMGGINGLETAQILRHTCPQSRVVLVTAHDNSEHRRAAIEAGATAFIQKDDFGLVWRDVLTSLGVLSPERV